jgi:hypothetical protein
VLAQFQAPKIGLLVYDATDKMQSTVAKAFAGAVVGQINPAFGEVPLLAVAYTPGSSSGGSAGAVLARGVPLYTLGSLQYDDVKAAFDELIRQWIAIAARR